VSEFLASMIDVTAQPPAASASNCAGRPELVVSRASKVESDDRRRERVFREHLDFVWRCLRRFGVPAEHADDVTQEVLIVAAKKLELVPEGREKGFLFAIAARVGANAKRSLRRREQMLVRYQGQVDEPTRNQEQLSEQLRARQLMDAVMAELSDELRAPFVLFEIEDWSIQEIAEALDLPIGTVGSRLRSARKAFSEVLRRHRARMDFKVGSSSGT
jgi:RNA polymerase sigma-70 factor (ECF subfamily)